MTDFSAIFDKVYAHGQLFGVEAVQKTSPFIKAGRRAHSVAVVGGALGDEGKGRVTDELTADFLKEHQAVIQYRDNGGANAGHTVEVGAMRIALHQLTSGITQPGCTVVLGKDMVIHPEDLVLELEEVYKALGSRDLPAVLKIDELAFLCLDTHRAFEVVLKAHSTGSLGSTGRGISPAYADIVYRHPLQMRDLMAKDWEQQIAAHYTLYEAWVRGFGYTLAEVKVPRLDGTTLLLGTVEEMTSRLAVARKVIQPCVDDVHELLASSWNSGVPFVFEKAQALGLDKRWGVYPDITASDCSFDGIFSSSEGIIDPNTIAVRAATIKATYSSSVGSRKLPTMMPTELAHRIREDAFEYGATTKRPRDIAYLDLPMLSYLFAVGRVEYVTITHLDVSYPELPVKVCIGYEIDGRAVPYRPDQTYLDKVTPVYRELPSWDPTAVRAARQPSELPAAAQHFLAFVTQSLSAQLLMVTTGPKREQAIKWY
jgi:adenylosuccinate synthase